MIVTFYPSRLSGRIKAVSSKSFLHRLLICSALCGEDTEIAFRGLSDDIRATISAIGALGKTALIQDDSMRITSSLRSSAIDAGESGSTFRFALPLIPAALPGSTVTVNGSPRLAARPISPLYEELAAHGAVMSDKGRFPMKVGGALRGGTYCLPGDISSQFVSGLLMALPLCPESSLLTVDGPLQSRPYVDITLACLRLFGIQVREADELFYIRGGQRCVSPNRVQCPGDFSGAAFFLAAGALGGGPVAADMGGSGEPQGDRAIVRLLERAGGKLHKAGGIVSAEGGRLSAQDTDASHIPDLVPILALVASVSRGRSRIYGAERLRFKESDRLSSVSALISALGGEIRELEDGMIIDGVAELHGGTVSSCSDHRVAMTAAIASCVSSGPVRVTGFEAVNKSYPDFLRDFAALGGRFTAEEE